MNVNVEFVDAQKFVFRHFSRILNHRPKRQKYASFEGVQKGVLPYFTDI